MTTLKVAGAFKDTSKTLCCATQKHGVVDIWSGAAGQPVSEINFLEHLPKIKHAFHIINRNIFQHTFRYLYAYKLTMKKKKDLCQSLSDTQYWYLIIKIIYTSVHNIV